MNTTTDDAQRADGESTRHRVLVMGAGYAGAAAAVQLAARTRRRADVDVTVVNSEDVFSERLRRHMAATGQPLARLPLTDLLDGTDAALLIGRVAGVDAGARTVELADRRRIGYDRLVWALGGVADTGTVPGVAEHAHTFDEQSGACAVAGLLDGPRPRTVVVCGGGLTGLETATEIGERFPHHTVTLIGRDEPGAGLGPRAHAHVRAVLERLGVRVRTGVVGAVRPTAVELADGDTVPADVVLWMAGTRGSPLAAAAGLTVDDRGRIVADASLRSVSHPEVLAVGDAVAVDLGYGVLHGTCQSGMPSGVHAATTILRLLDGRAPRPFRFGYYHTPVSLGRRDGVVQFTRPDDSPRRLVLTGRLAARYKETVTASPWPTFLRMRRVPASGAVWPRGGHYTRAAPANETAAGSATGVPR